MPLTVHLVAALPDIAALALVQDQLAVHQHMRGVYALGHESTVVPAPGPGNGVRAVCKSEKAAQKDGFSDATS